MTRRQLWVSVLIGSALSLIGANRIANQQLIIGSSEGGWVTGYAAGFSSRSVEFFLVASVLMATAVAITWPWLRSLSNDDRGGVGPASAPAGAMAVKPFQEWALILGWCLLAAGLQGLLRFVSPYSLGAIFSSDIANSFYSVALKFDAGSILGDFERLRPSWALHAQSNLPGKLLLVRALIHNISAHPHVLAWLIVLLSNVGGVLVYIFVRDLFADRFVAALSVILYLFTPAKFFFFPLLNTVTPVVVLACACLLLRWLHTGKTLYAVSLGVAIYGLILFEPTALIVGLLFGVLLVHTLATGRMVLRSAVIQIVAGLLALVAAHLAMRLFFGFDLVSAFRSAAADAVAFNADARRPYDVWVRQNIVDFLFGVGFCQIVLFAPALADGMARLKRHERSPDAVAIVLLCLSMLAMVGMADGIGVNRGEVIRLWIFLACLWQIPAAYVCRRLESSRAFTLVLAATLLQNTLGTAMLAFVVP